MQVVQGNFYQSNPRPGADGGLEHERQLLVEEQKLCRSRARKFSLETNRRRKALEDRRKQWDVQEQQLIENVLKQRRQRAQDATERFQRAYLPPSQRRRQPLRRNVPNIEEALNQIQGSSSSYAQQPSFLSSNSHVSRSCTPSPGPPAVSKSSHRQALSAVAAYTKLLQEQSTASLKSSHQTEKPPEKQHDHSPQDSQLSDSCNTESLSSKDSLENDDPDHSTRNLQYPYSSLLIDSEKLHPVMREQKDLCPTSDLTSLSALMLLSDHLPQSRKLREPDQQKHGDSEGPNKKKLQISKASWGFAAYEQTPTTETTPALHNCNVLSLCEIISGGPEHFEVNASQNSPSDNIIATNRDASSRTALHSSRPKQEALLDLRRNEVHDELKHPPATEMILLAKNGNNKVFGPPLPISLNDTTTDNGSQKGNLQQTGTKIHNLSSQKEPRSSINNLNKVSNPEPTTEKPINETNSLSNIQSDSPKCLTCAEQEVPNVPVSVRSSHSVCEVRFIKGILKKQSKYMSGDTTRVYGSGHLIFTKQVALAIRDSVELTRTKAKDVGGNNGVKKKLRWSDEVNVQKEDKEQNIMKQMKGKSSNLSQSNNNSEDHQLSLTTVSGASKPGPGMTPPASSGYHFTKQAWADVGVQVSLPQERADEVKVPRSSTRTGGPKVPRRERSARVGAGPVSSRTRKGTVIRPQSATEVSRIAKTQGKILEPRPPPRMESDKTAHIAKTPYGAAHTGVNCKQALAEQAPHKDDSDGSYSPYTHNVIRTDSTVMYTPLPPSCTFSISKGNVKGRPSSGHHGCRRRRGMGNNDKGLCLDCTPTDEEILQLWHGVRGALATKDATNLLRRQALDCGRVARKPCMEQSRQPAGSGIRMLPQPTKQTSEPVRLSSAYNTAFPDSGLVSAAQAHLAEAHAGGRLEETDIVAAVETAQTQRSGTVQQRSQQQALTTISLEEQKILLSLDRLNHQLYCTQEHVGGYAGRCGLVLMDAPSTRDVTVTNHHKQRAFSATSRYRHQKKF